LFIKERIVLFLNLIISVDQYKYKLLIFIIKNFKKNLKKIVFLRAVKRKWQKWLLITFLRVYFFVEYYLTSQISFLSSQKVSFFPLVTFFNCVTFAVRMRHILMYVVYYYITIHRLLIDVVGFYLFIVLIVTYTTEMDLMDLINFDWSFECAYIHK